MLKGFNAVCDVQVYWKIVEEQYYLRPSSRHEYERLLRFIAKLYSYIIEYQARVICHLSKAEISRTWESTPGWNDWEWNSMKVQDLSEHYNDYIQLLDVEAIRERWRTELQNMQESQAILDKIRRVLETTRNRMQKFVLSQTAQNVKQYFASDYEVCKNFNPQRVKGTCEWFFRDERFRKWRESDFGLLWVTAGPGCGKSVLARALIDERRLSPNIATSTVCYFFSGTVTNTTCTLLML